MVTLYGVVFQFSKYTHPHPCVISRIIKGAITAEIARQCTSSTTPVVETGFFPTATLYRNRPLGRRQADVGGSRTESKAGGTRMRRLLSISSSSNIAPKR